MPTDPSTKITNSLKDIIGAWLKCQRQVRTAKRSIADSFRLLAESIELMMPTIAMSAGRGWPGEQGQQLRQMALSIRDVLRVFPSLPVDREVRAAMDELFPDPPDNDGAPVTFSADELDILRQMDAEFGGSGGGG